MRILAALPIAFCLALLIILENPFHRALVVAALVLLEVLRDAISMGEAASSTADALKEVELRRSGRLQKSKQK